MIYTRKLWRQLLGHENTESVRAILIQSIENMFGVKNDDKIVEKALWDSNPVVSYSIEDNIAVILPSRSAGRMIETLEDYLLITKK